MGLAHTVFSLYHGCKYCREDREKDKSDSDGEDIGIDLFSLAFFLLFHTVRVIIGSFFIELTRREKVDERFEAEAEDIKDAFVCDQEEQSEAGVKHARNESSVADDIQYRFCSGSFKNSAPIGDREGYSETDNG